MIDGSLKTHQAAPGTGKFVHPNVNDSSMSEQSVDLQTVDRLHVPDAAAAGGDALNAHSKGLDSTAGRSSTAGSTVDNTERQLLQQQDITVQCHVPLTRGDSAQNISGGGDAVGGDSTEQTAQNSKGQIVHNSTDQTEHGRQAATVSGRPEVVVERQSDQNLSLVSPLDDAEYDAHLGLSARQQEQLVPQNLPAVPGPLRGDKQMRL